MLFLVSAGLFAPLVLSGAPVETGTITGRVFSQAHGEFLTNARVQVEGTTRVAYTDDDGSFSVTGVPVGDATVTVSHTGHRTTSRPVTVSSECSTRVDITLSGSPADRDDVVELPGFDITSEADATARAIREQCRSMNIITAAASDFAGEPVDANVGELLKFLPGVELDYIDSEARLIRLGGLDPKYTGLTIDGVKLATADAQWGAGAFARAPSLEAASIAGIESVDISITTSPEMDADAPAGTVNLKTRRVFDREGRRFAYKLGLNLNSEAFTLDRTPGPDDRMHHKARPNYFLEYSDVLLDRRLGIVLSVDHAESYTEQYRMNIDYTRATEDGSGVWEEQTINFKDGPKLITRDTFSIRADFRATEDLTLSLAGTQNTYLGEYHNRDYIFRSNRVELGGKSSAKETRTLMVIPRFEYRHGRWTFDGSMSFSESINDYSALERGFAHMSSVSAITRSSMIADRPNQQSTEWTIRQVSGPDWFDLGNYPLPAIWDDGRFASTTYRSGAVNARWETRSERFPLQVKFGAKWLEESRTHTNESGHYRWLFVGPDGGPAGSFEDYPSINLFDMGSTHALTTLNKDGKPAQLQVPDRNTLGELFRTHPEYYVHLGNRDSFYSSVIAGNREIRQTVWAGYVMVDFRPFPALEIRGGVRRERTENNALEYDPKTLAEVRDAGFHVASNEASGIEGLKFRYFTNPRLERVKKYDTDFPMVAVKWRILDALHLHLGYNEAISQPALYELTGMRYVDFEHGVVTSPNPNLLPEYSRNYAARLAHYFGPAGQLSVTFRQNDIRNFREYRQGTSEEFGNTDPALATFDFVTHYNVDDPVRFRSMDAGYTHLLSFLPRPLHRTTAHLAYTRAYQDRPLMADQPAPHRLTASLGLRLGDFYLRPAAWWRDETWWTDGNSASHHTGQVWQLDLGGGWKISERLEIFFQGRNIFNKANRLWYRNAIDDDADGVLERMESSGASWVFGIRGEWK